MNTESHKYERYTLENRESRWADPEEIKKSFAVTRINVTDDNCPGCGLPLISDGRTAYVDNSDTHSIIFGSTGSKKTRLFGMPLINMFALAGESFIATDPKGELYQKTSGMAADKGYKNIVLNFRDLANSSFWNPLAIPYELYHSGKTDEGISLINDFLTLLAEPQMKSAKDAYWINMGYSMALAYMLFFIETAAPEEANIINFVNFFVSKSSVNDADNISKCMAKGSIAGMNIKGILINKDSEKTYSSVTTTVVSMFSSFMIRRSLCRMLSKSSFDVRGIGREKTAIYIILPDEKTTFNFLVTTFIKQTYEALINEAQQQENKMLSVRLNFLLDEFCNIPAIPDMPSMISAARSRNMRFFLMVQGMDQLSHKYGCEANTIMGNCENLVFLSSKEYGLLSEISNLCGNTDYHSIDGSIQCRPLISTSELQRLKKEKGEALILHGRHYPLVTELPDIGEYAFKTYPPIEVKARKLPEIMSYDADDIIYEIMTKQRPLAFSKEVFGHDIYFGQGSQ